MDDIISELNPVSSAPSIEQAQSHNAAADNRQGMIQASNADFEATSLRPQHQKIAPSEKNQSAMNNLRSPKKAHAPTAAHNGKKIAANNVKSSGYGQANANGIRQVRSNGSQQYMGDQQRDHVKDGNTVSKKTGQM